jgi:Ca2+-binding RTX toxin-like protein
VEDLNPGPASSSPDQLIEVNGQLIFAATTPDVGRELYAIQIDPPAPTSPLVPTSTAGDTTSGGNGSEPLAPLPTVNVTTLRISGTSNDDSIRVFLRASNNKMLEVDDDGVISAYRARDISLIQIDAGDGNDTIKFDESNGAITIASKLYGDAGDDSITGGDGADRILGGDGNDWIEGSGGNDIIYGQAGNDRLFGGDGKDHIDGGAGTNVIRGEGGLDTIVASIGDDIRGNKGDVLDQLQA